MKSGRSVPIAFRHLVEVATDDVGVLGFTHPEDLDEGLIEFDDALFGHIGYGISNLARSFFLALTHAKFSRVPLNTPTRRYYQNINRYSAAFALASDFAMLTLGGALKKRELLSW